MATSQDGYIADKNGSVEWLAQYSDLVDQEEDYGYRDFLASLDTIVMGSKAYKQMLSFGPWPYSGIQTYVFTWDDLSSDCDTVTFISGSIQDFMDKQRDEKPNSRIWLFGGAELASSFFELGIIDEFVFTIIPKTLGDGLALSIPLHELRLVSEKKFGNGVLQRRYKNRRSR